jgi:hypothetical protein
VCAKARVMSGVHGSAPVLERFGEVSLARIVRRRDGEGAVGSPAQSTGVASGGFAPGAGCAVLTRRPRGGRTAWTASGPGPGCCA